MISKNVKLKVVLRDKNYYWYIKKNEEGSPRIHIGSEDKKLYLEYGFDRELAIDNTYIINLLTNYFDKK